METNDNIIESLGPNPENNEIEKTRMFFDLLSNADLNISEAKIIDTYLSRINSHDPSKKRVRFKKTDFEKLLNLKQIRTDEMEKRLKHLLQPFVLRNFDGKGNDLIMHLFESAYLIKDEYGINYIDLTCSEDAAKYIFNIDEIGYLRYKLRCVANIKMDKAYAMFLYIEFNRFRKEWVVDLDELKKILKCQNQATYAQFKHFNSLVLKKVKEELVNNTECNYDYKPIEGKDGKTIVAVKFWILNDIERLTVVNSDCIDEDTVKEKQEKLMAFVDKNLWASNFCDEDCIVCEFTLSELEELRSLLVGIPVYKLPPDAMSGTNDYNLRLYNYVSILKSRLERACEEKADTQNNIKNRFHYIKKMIENDMCN